MRDFSRTAEPRGESPTAQPGHRPGHSFVIQQHAARRMHYDFRLELDGVLLSWSVPKGPSLSPTERRLAVRTEDHPLDYASFEGVIPKGEYGGGTVVVWDRGSWEPEGDARAAVDSGKLTFTLHGEKLSGRWHLVKTRSDGKAENWLLFKARDADASDRIDVVAARPASVLSGRTIDEVAAAPDRIWHSKRHAAPGGASEAGEQSAQAAPRTASQRSSRGRDGGTRDVRSARGADDKHVARPARTHATGRRAHAPAARNRSLTLVEQLPLGFALSNLDKVLFPDQGITKGDLIAYLAVISESALPHLADRPVMIVRCPDGLRAHAEKRARACFYQKHVLPGSPPAIDTVDDVDSDGAAVRYMRVHDMPGVVALAQLGTLEIHTWGCHAATIEQPDLMVFDLDPDIGVPWERVALGAFELRRRLHDAGLESFVKTTGGKGLHVVAPIARGPGWDDFKAFTKAVVEAIQHDEPGLYTTNMAKAQRKGKIFLDYLRNGRGATFIAPYSPRARPGAPVAVPISWEELAHGVDPASFTIVSVPRRLATPRDDPWASIHEIRQAITARAWHTVGGKRP